jgi:hypothetical protein
MQDFFGNDLSVGDIVIASFGSPWGDKDVYEYCEIERFTNKAVIVNRLKLKPKNETRRMYAHHLIKIDPAQYTMYILKKQKETV